jgi:16S rRNA (adenine1518-N6/adenine1519-N6)-dimethyltransferase
MVPLAEVPQVDPAVLQAMVAVAFSQRRKLLRHTLGAWIVEMSALGMIARRTAVGIAGF